MNAADGDLQAWVLSRLAAHDGASPAALRKALGLPMSVCLRTLAELEALGLVERRSVGRREGVFLSARGTALLRTANGDAA